MKMKTNYKKILKIKLTLIKLFRLIKEFLKIQVMTTFFKKILKIYRKILKYDLLSLYIK